MCGENVEFCERVFEVGLVELRDLLRGFVFALGAYFHLVFSGIALGDIVAREMPHIGNVFDMTHFVPGMHELPTQDIRSDIRFPISDMRVVIHRRSAGVHIDLAFFYRLKKFLFFGAGVI